MRTGFWFQLARGRAIVRGRSMNQARSIKRAIVSVRADRPNYRDHVRTIVHRSETAWLPKEQLLPILNLYLKTAVSRAREANKDWRRYRANSAECD